MRTLPALACAAGVAWATAAANGLCAETPAPLAAARALLDQGKYAEAEEAFAALAAEHGVAAALGAARAQQATGRREQAERTLAAAAASHPQAAELSAERARLALDRGDFPAAEARVAEALKIDPHSVAARLAQADGLAATGQLDEANQQYQWLVNHFNAHDELPIDPLLCIGRGAAEFARWNRLSDQFGFLVNEFYPDLLKADPGCWQAHYETGRLFAEKYNRSEADKEYKAALALNANAAEVHVAVGELALEGFELDAALAACEQALAINRQLLGALHLKADIHLANFEPREAALVLGEALKLHPASELTLGRLAATYLAADGPTASGADSRFGKLAAEVDARNPHAGSFYLALGDALDRLRRWPAAARCYRQASERMPQLIAPPGRLGMMLMRLGEEDEARRVLHASFDADPFNVRVNNTLKVLEVLQGYETHETDHFRIRFDPRKDRILVRYMGQWLEEVYPQLVEQMGFAPPDKSLFEVFCAARNTDGHGWFSARMVGLPRIHPIGACAGKIVALQSPSEGPQRFNWARVLKHEFVHVINLQQTDFNIPHWFTEALAVLNEGYPRPQEWNDLLVERAAGNKLFTLDTINLGFIRPQSSNDWTLAYCQAELYAEYLLERFGADAIARMLAAYGDNLTTPEALRRAFDVDVADFESGYAAFVRKIVADLPPAAADDGLAPAELQKRLAAHPNDAGLLAAAARDRLERRNFPESRRLADQALAADPRNQLAHYVRARLHLLVGENRAALARLEQGLDRAAPQANLLALLAGLKLKAEDFSAAAELYELGARVHPGDPKWLKSLASVYLKSGDEVRLAKVLRQLAGADPDDLPVRKKLAQLALAGEDWAAVARWTLEGLHIQVMDADLHRWRGAALRAQGDAPGAATELAVAVELDPDDVQLRLALADALVEAERPAEAKAALTALLERQPDHAAARKKLESLP